MIGVLVILSNKVLAGNTGNDNSQNMSALNTEQASELSLEH